MEKKINLKLIDPVKYFLGFLAGVALFIATLIVAASYVLSQAWGKPGLWLVCIGSGILPYFLLKRLAVHKAVVLVEAERVTVHRSDRALPITIPYADVVSYSNSSIRTRSVLRFKMADGTEYKLVAEELLGKAGDFWEVVRAVDQAAEQYRSRLAYSQRSADGFVVDKSLASKNYVPMSRERGFFEKRRSTVLFTIMTVAIGLGLLFNALRGWVVGPMLAMSIGAWFIYLVPWLLGMDARIQNAENDKS